MVLLFDKSSSPPPLPGGRRLESVKRFENKYVNQDTEKTNDRNQKQRSTNLLVIIQINCPLTPTLIWAELRKSSFVFKIVHIPLC